LLYYLIQLVEIACFGLLGLQGTSPHHESTQFDTVCCIREVRSDSDNNRDSDSDSDSNRNSNSNRKSAGGAAGGAVAGKRRRASKKSKPAVKYQHKVGNVLAFHGNNEETGCEEAYVGEVTRRILDDNGGPGYTLHYFDMVNAGAADGELPDAGGCYHRVADPDDSSLAWTQDVGEGEILAEVVWGACADCTFHMGDEQWEDIEAKMNSAFDENYSSDDEDMQSVPDADVSVPWTPKDVECKGPCGRMYYSLSGTSTHCLDCRTDN
jgi:hypothetical protein